LVKGETAPGKGSTAPQIGMHKDAELKLPGF